MAGQPGKFVTGSTMRHVVVMTLTGSLGLSFMFMVEFLGLWWISRLGQEINIAAIGFAGTIQFTVVSVTIGMVVATVALVSRTLGAGDPARARRIAGASMVMMAGVQSVVALLTFLFRREILALSGADGPVLEIAADFLAVTLPSLPFIAMGMCAAAVMRAAGDAWRAMVVTASAGLVAAIADPILIVWMGWGVHGAAIAIILSRFAMTALGLYWLISVHDLVTFPRLSTLRNHARPFMLIAIPAVATQLSTPFGNWLLTRAMSEHGDSAVAGWGVAVRMQFLVFGGIFALSGAIGGIIGQNYGAGRMDRVQQAFIDALKFCALYTVVAWGVLSLATGPLVRSFGLGDAGAEVMETFGHYVSATFLFTGAIFVANAAFNNLGRPAFSTAVNWSRDGLLVFPIALVLGAMFGGPGVVWALGVANVIVGTLAGLWAWTYVKRRNAPAPPTAQ